MDKARRERRLIDILRAKLKSCYAVCRVLENGPREFDNPEFMLRLAFLWLLALRVDGCARPFLVRIACDRPVARTVASPHMNLPQLSFPSLRRYLWRGRISWLIYARASGKAGRAVGRSPLCLVSTPVGARRNLPFSCLNLSQSYEDFVKELIFFLLPISSTTRSNILFFASFAFASSLAFASSEALSITRSTLIKLKSQHLPKPINHISLQHPTTQPNNHTSNSLKNQLL